jgi:hypothetical protein
LRFVEDQQHAALDAFLPQRRQIPLRQLYDPAAAENRLGDKRGEVAGALPVYEVESVVELGLPIDAGKAGAIGVRRRYREATGR